MKTLLPLLMLFGFLFAQDIYQEFMKVYIFPMPFRGHEESKAKADYIALLKEPIKALDEGYNSELLKIMGVRG